MTLRRTNTRRDICDSRPMNPRRPKRRFLRGGQRKVQPGSVPVPAVQNNSPDNSQLKERRRMTWIKTVRMDEDDRVKSAMEAQRKLYPIEYATPVHPVNDGATSGIVASHTLLPDVLFHAFSTFGALMSPDLPLKRHQHEMIATMVSVTNRCHY